MYVCCARRHLRRQLIVGRAADIAAMAYMAMAYIVMAYIVMAYIVMAYIVMAAHRGSSC